jgi:O-antigen/teichoic acid export membrane protein
VNRKEVASGFFWNFLFGLPNRLLFPIIGILIARRLGPEELGIYVLLTTILSIADIIRDAGLSHTYIADPEGDKPEREGAYATFAVTTSLALAAALFISRYAIADFFDLPQLPWGLTIVAIAIVLNGLQTISGAKLHRQARFKEVGITQTSATFVAYIVALVLAYYGFGFEALVWHMLIRGVLQLIFVYWAAPTTLRAVKWEFLKTVLARSASTFTQNLMYSVYTILDNALVAKLFGKGGIGYYGNAWSLGIKPIEFVSFPLSGALFVAYTRFSGDREKFASAYCRSLAAAALASLPLFIYIGLFARELILVLYTPKFANSIPLLQLLAVYFGFRSLGTLAGSALVAAGKPFSNVISWAAGYIVAGTGIWLAWGEPNNIVHSGVAGATVTHAWGSLTLWSAVAWISAGAVTAYTFMLVSSMAHLRPTAGDLGRIGRAIVTALPAAAACIFVRLTPLDGALLLVAGGLATAAVHVASIGLFYSGKITGATTPSGLREIWRGL